jgi:soluble lytic murein transglycosylase
MFIRSMSLIPTILVAVALLSGPASAQQDVETLLEQQRTAFRTVYAAVERGNWQPVEQYEAILKNYVLWPDLRATFLRATLKNADHEEIDAFLHQYGVLKPARELRYRYALHLADEDRKAEYLGIYQQFYQGLDIANLDCLALQAEIEIGAEDRVTGRARDLWLVGKSQAEECDPVFEHLRRQNLLTARHYADRFNLAIESKRFTLARHLARSLDARYLNEAEEWLSAQNQAEEFIAGWQGYADTDLTKRLFAYAIDRLTYDDPITASRHWSRLASHFSFTVEQNNDVMRHIALWAARKRLPQAETMLQSLPESARDVETGRWLIRTGLLSGQWPAVIDRIDDLPADEGQKEEWRFWKAYALRESGAVDAATDIFSALALTRSYYGFLAADATDGPYALAEAPVRHNQEVSAAIAQKPGLIRARELFHAGLEGRGRSEWDSAVRLMTSEEQTQAALLADSWGWHSRAISTVASAGEFDDLRVRYPLPWRDVFEKHANTAGVSHSWAYGIARSESLFMRDIRSSAGAIGVMQLMPDTGRSTAREIRVPWSGLATLIDSASNIRLGTHYLSKMFARFGDNRVLATAAYNAGPGRVDEWLPETGSVDARIWIENIPFNETRGYVRRVLTDDVIFHWRITGQQRRLSSDLELIAAAVDKRKAVAAN